MRAFVLGMVIAMDLVNIEGKQTEYLSIYNSSGQNVVVYISSNDQRDYTEDVEDILNQKQGETVTLSDILEGLDIAVLINKDEAAKEFQVLIEQIERWKINENK
ncbi:hypothetical protein P7D31_09875 [Enterococcus dongliensis]|uniref:hypothetical protein n=1 Tax=Enterococcus dongliensis TaxID=2559925 RepID=UPI0028903437|nr:hypothetical protein [Enterococcus dongliensis]MDT2640423.1 hypothetical protein [Enterococcus dongliensis]